MENARLGDPKVSPQKCVWHGEWEVKKSESEPHEPCKPSFETVRTAWSLVITLSLSWFNNCGCFPGSVCTAIERPISPGTWTKAEFQNMMTERLDTGPENSMNLSLMIQTGTEWLILTYPNLSTLYHKMKRPKTRIINRLGGFTGGGIVASKNFILRSFKVTGNLILL